MAAINIDGSIVFLTSDLQNRIEIDATCSGDLSSAFLCCSISNLVMEVEFLRQVMGHTSLFLQVFGSRIEAGEKLLQLAVVSGIFILAAQVIPTPSLLADWTMMQRSIF